MLMVSMQASQYNNTYHITLIPEIYYFLYIIPTVNKSDKNDTPDFNVSTPNTLDKHEKKPTQSLHTIAM